LKADEIIRTENMPLTLPVSMISMYYEVTLTSDFFTLIYITMQSF